MVNMRTNAVSTAATRWTKHQEFLGGHKKLEDQFQIISSCKDVTKKSDIRSMIEPTT